MVCCVMCVGCCVLVGVCVLLVVCSLSFGFVVLLGVGRSVLCVVWWALLAVRCCCLLSVARSLCSECWLWFVCCLLFVNV